MTGTPPLSPPTSESQTSPQQNQNSTPHIQSVPSLSTDSTSALGNIVLSKGPASSVLNREQDSFSATNPTVRRPHSPLKRLASELDDNTDLNGNPIPEEGRQLSKRPSNHLFRDTDQDVEMDGTDESFNVTNPMVDETSTPQPQQQQPSTTSTNDASSATDAAMTPVPSSEFPSVDDQIKLVLEARHKALVEGDDQYIISCTWLQRFLNQGEDFKPSKEEDTPTAPGPIDNSDIAEIAQKDLLSPPTDTAGAFKSMFPKQLQIPKAKSTPTPSPTTPTNIPVTEDNPFPDYVALKNGQLGEDYEALPKEMWDMLVTWYGLAKNSPIIRRKVVNTAGSDEDLPNLQIELHPLLFTIQKLRSSSAPVTHKSLGKAPALTIVASRGEKYMSFLKRVKAAASCIRPVQVWRVTVSAATTPRRSRSPSPAFGLGRKKDKVPEIKMEIDLKEFNEIPDTDKVLVELKDQTHNASYNGRATIDIAGLGMGGRLVIEEQDESKGWDSEIAGKTLAPKADAPTSLIKKMQSQGRELINSTTRRSTPSQSPRSSSPAGGIMTRGREKKIGKPLGKCGLQNLGNTCYMNSALQCLRSVEELSKYFLSSSWKGELNPSNPLAHGGKVAAAYADLLNRIYDSSSPNSYCPTNFKNTIGRFGPSFSGYGQQDTQEFLAFLLDGLHEDLNRIHKKPYVEKPDSTDEMIGNPALIAELAQKCWDIYKARNDSAVADLFGGLYKSTLVCPHCQKVSITFDPFMDLTLPLPVENVWSHEVVFVPARGERPKRITVELEKSKSVKDLKEYIGKKFGVDVKKLMASEVYKNKFFQHYDDNRSLSEAVTPNDRPYVYELDEVPTNYPPRRRKYKTKSMLNIGPQKPDPEEEEEKAQMEQCLLIPVLTRIGPKKGGNENFVASPFYVTINKEEARDYDRIFRKVVEAYQSWTSASLQDDASPAEAESPVPQDTEMVEVDGKAEGDTENGNITEEGYVNVQMSEGQLQKGKETAAPATPASSSKFDKSKVPIHLREVMKLRAVKGTKVRTEVPCGWSDLSESSVPIINRLEVIQRPAPKVTEEGTDDEATPPAADAAGSPASDREDPEMKDVSDEDEDTPMTTPAGGSIFANPPIVLKNNMVPPLRANSPAETDLPLVRLNEAIIVEWTPEGYDGVFGGKSSEDTVKGFGFFDERSMEQVRDEEMERKSELRANRRTKGVHLEDCLDEFAKEEILSEDDPWYCPRCKEHRRASKKFELWKCPDILVIHLKRFSSSTNRRDKLDCLIKFPIEGLDLTQRIGEPHEGKNMIYDLIAVDNHYGGLGGGHYTAYAKNWADGKWYNFDDSHASPLSSPQNAVTPAAYLLFYRRRSSTPLGGSVFERIITEPGSLPQHVGGYSNQGMGPSPATSSASSRSSSPGAGPSTNGPGLLAFGGANSSSTLFGPRPADELPAYSQLPSDSEATINIGYSIGESPLDIDAEMASGEVSSVSSVVELDTNDVDLNIPEVKNGEDDEPWSGNV